MAFDFKKEYKEFYLPKQKPQIVEIPPMTFVAVHGIGNPNEEGGAYEESIAILYSIAYTIKMSKMGDHRIDGYFDFVVPPLEGFWWQQGVKGIDYTHKESFEWISAIRLPDFVTLEEFDWAKKEAAEKKGLDTSSAELLTIDEGLCAQVMHLGPYDEEPATIALMDAFVEEAGYINDMSDTPEGRHHHELYLSDARRVDPAKLKTVIRHPIKKKSS